jgi:hypothetical protein
VNSIFIPLNSAHFDQLIDWVHEYIGPTITPTLQTDKFGTAWGIYWGIHGSPYGHKVTLANEKDIILFKLRWL